MAPKLSSSTTKEKLIGDEDEVLQAIILADSFNKRFKPLTTRKPRVRNSFPSIPPPYHLASISLSRTFLIITARRIHSEIYLIFYFYFVLVGITVFASDMQRAATRMDV
jgi:hypothetical protein